MVEAFFHDQILQIIAFQILILLVILSNAHLLNRARRHAPPAVFPTVSILIPARNEEKNIARCTLSLLSQDYPSFEVLVLDDQSSDATRPILEQLSESHPSLCILAGSPPPPGWLGKNWACMQLAQQAHGELLFFTDADTFHRPHTLRACVTALAGERADLLTGFPRQLLGSWGERLLVPFFSWASLSFNSLWLAYQLHIPAFSSAVGQMMLFRRQAYDAIGGHGSVASEIVEDMLLAKKAIAAGQRWRVADITDLVACRMYDSSRAAFHGFSKNYFAAFGYRLLIYLFVFVWLAVMFLKPLFLPVWILLGKTTATRPESLIICIGLSLLIWLISYAILGAPLFLALLYPLTIVANVGVALHSLWLSLTGNLTWKDRPLTRPRWKWL